MFNFAPQILFEEMEGIEGSKALFLHATEGIIVVDHKGFIVQINPSADKIFGYDQGELIGKTIETLVPMNHASKHIEQRNKFISNPHSRSMGIGMELYGLKKDGKQLPVEISLSPYSSTEGQFVIAFIIDITLRKQAEDKIKNYSAELEKQVKNRTLILEEAVDELEKTKRNLHDALEKERELNELKSRFVSMASHEFRTPLATILSSLSLVKKYGELNEKEKQGKHIGRIKSSINDLTDILNDFLSVSKLEEGKDKCVPEKFNLKEFTSGIVSEMQSIAKEDQKVIYEHTGAEIVNLDKKLLKNVLFNLVSNAIKFSPEAKPIHIETEFTNAYLQIQVRDSGIGISAEDKKHLFERFFRGHNATHVQGTGLGLSIVAKYVELMNGSISFDSKEKKGTTFSLRFPQ